MAGTSANTKVTSVQKRTSQGGRPKTSTMNKSQKVTFKRYRGQGRGK